LRLGELPENLLDALLVRADLLAEVAVRVEALGQLVVRLLARVGRRPGRHPEQREVVVAQEPGLELQDLLLAPVLEVHLLLDGLGVDGRLLRGDHGRGPGGRR